MPTNTIGHTGGSINDFAVLYQRFMGIPPYVSGADLSDAVSVHLNPEDNAPTDQGWMSNRLRNITGLTSHHELLSGKMFFDWRDIRREVYGTLAILRSLVQTASSEGSEKGALYSGEVSIELDILKRQFGHIKESSSCNGTLSAAYLLAASDPLLFQFEHGWSEGCLTALGLTHYQVCLDGNTYPMSYPEHMARSVRRFDFARDGEFIHMARSAHAYAVKNLIEDITDMALGIGTSDRPVRLIVRFDKRRETIDIETPGDDRLFEAMRENREGKTDQLRQDHDGWWLEDSRIVIPVSPLHYFGILEDYESEAWKRAAGLLPLMRRIKDGDNLTREEFRRWETDLGWIVRHSQEFWLGRQEASEIGKITRLIRAANDQVSKEGRVVAVLGAKLKNWFQQHHFLADAYSKSSSAKSSLDTFKRYLSAVYAAGFPSRVELLKHYYLALSGNESSIFNLDLAVDISSDVVVSARTQYAMHRVINDILLFSAQLAAGTDTPVQLAMGYDGDRLHFVNRGGSGTDEGVLVRQFFADPCLQPKIVREASAWAAYASADGRGLTPNGDMTGMSIAPDIATAKDLEMDFAPSIVVPVGARPLASYAQSAVKGGFLTFYPTSTMKAG
jgi:hypothetical protein